MREGGGRVIHNLLIGLHIIAVIAWMAGLLYLPRLFAYHTRAEPGSQMDETFRIMEAKLMAMIINPASFAVAGFGAALIWNDVSTFGWAYFERPWAIAKLAGVVFLFGWHGFLSRERKKIAAGTSTRTERFWRATNELPFLAAIIIVLAATMKW
jgi:protoporphyrinogen IX oxidase